MAIERGPAGSRLTVLLALAANAGIAVLKAIAGLLTGSAALMSEAAHSVGDSVTEVLLLTALRRSARPADRRHPFGYGKERYFWSLLAAMGILVSGAGFSFYQGVRAITGGPAGESRTWLNYIVLAISAVLEGVSFGQSYRELRAQAAAEGVGKFAYLRDPEDPTVKSVVLEDSAALIGLTLAFAGVGARQLTGSPVWDGLAALAIGVLLVAVAFFLARTNMGLLIGKQANLRLVRRVRAFLEGQPEVDKLVDLLSMMVGTGRVLFGALDEVFLEPVPRNDADLRARVLARYGDILDRPVPGR